MKTLPILAAIMLSIGGVVSFAVDETIVLDGIGGYVKIPDSQAATSDLLLDAKKAAGDAWTLIFHAGWSRRTPEGAVVRTADEKRLIVQNAPKIKAQIRAAIDKLKAAEVSLERDVKLSQ